MRCPTIKALQKHLASAPRLCQVCLVASSDDYERGKIFDELLKILLSSDSLVTRFTGVDVSLRNVFDELSSLPLLGAEPVVIFDEVEKMHKKQIQTLSDFILETTFSGSLLIGSRTKTALAAVVEKRGAVLDLTDEKPWDKEKRLAQQLTDRAKNAGKQLGSGVAQMLLERAEKDSAALESEMDKLICFVGERPSILKEDVFAVSNSFRLSTLWQMAETVVWGDEAKGGAAPVDSSSFQPLISAIRGQLKIGLTIASLIQEKISADQWSRHLPKIFPKTLEKRSSQAARFGVAYFLKGLDSLFEIELLSRDRSTQYAALFDLLRAKMTLSIRNL